MPDDSEDILELARERGLITDAQLARLREERTRLENSGRPSSAARLAIQTGVLSEGDMHDLETEAWVQDLPRDLDGYHLVRLIGRGGMAVVFEARDVSLDKTVAIKILLPEFSSSESYLARFSREAHIAAQLTHPNVVQVFRVGEMGDTHFLVMEYVEGETVSGIIKRQGSIPEEEATDIVFQIAGALEEAAGMGILHRDIKPANILVSKWAVPKLADFGIAKAIGDLRDPRIQRSLTMGVVGTPSYMSPEQARGARDLDFRSDVYSLGATLYHMLVGAAPFFADTPQETMVRVVSDSPSPPRAVSPQLSDATAAVICKMMAKSPDDRYADFEELRADLAAARDGESVSLTYRQAAKLLLPADGEADEAEEVNVLRIVFIAFAVAAFGLLLVWLLRSCG